MVIVPVARENAADWAGLCHELWPRHSEKEMLDAFFRQEYRHEYLGYVNGICAAFVSLSVRHEYVEGKEGPGPVGYLEGIYVRPEYRKRGLARELVQFAKQWAAEQGCFMLASDCALANRASRLFHRKLGFAEAGVNVHFVMDLRGRA